METTQTQTAGINSFHLKIIAIIGMTLDHIGIIFNDHLSLPAETALYALGGLTFPIMAYLLVQGYHHTSNFKRYALRLFVFALVTQIPYSLFLENRGNVLFTILIGLLMLYLYDHMERKWLFWIIFAIVSLTTVFLDWGLMGVPMVMLYSRLKGKWSKLVIPILIPIGLMLAMFASALSVGRPLSALPQLLYALIGCTLTVPLLASYNGERGRPAKYLFYAYYPLHILVIGCIEFWIYR